MMKILEDLDIHERVLRPFATYFFMQEPSTGNHHIDDVPKEVLNMPEVGMILGQESDVESERRA
jgi:hypothetical protein